MWKIEIDENQNKFINNIEEVESFIISLNDQLKNNIPYIISIVDNNGNVLMVGVGDKISVLNYSDSTLKPPYYSSIGNKEISGIVKFLYMGQITEIPKKNTIPGNQAFNAIKEFLIDGQRPKCIQWEED